MFQVRVRIRGRVCVRVRFTELGLRLGFGLELGRKCYG